jgi:hypothetical protein
MRDFRIGRRKTRADLSNVPSTETGADVERNAPIEDKLRELAHGPYYVAPDSADPLPSTIWTRADPDDLTAEFEQLNELAVDGLTEAEKDAPDVMTHGFFYLKPAQREYLESVGGTAVRELLATFQELDKIVDD